MSSATSSHSSSSIARVAAGKGLFLTLAHVSARKRRSQSDHWAMVIVVGDAGDGDGDAVERLAVAAMGAALNVVRCEHAHTVRLALDCVAMTLQPATDHAETASSQWRQRRVKFDEADEATDAILLPPPFGMRIAIRLVGRKPDTLMWRPVPAASTENDTSGESATRAPSANAYTLRR